MFSKLGSKFSHSLAFRLTLWYAVVFAGTLCCAFAVIYLLLALEFRNRTDRDLERQLTHFSTLLAIQDIESVKAAAAIETQAAGEKEVFMRMLTPSGEIFLSSSRAYWRDLKVNPKVIRRLLEGEPAVKETVTLKNLDRDVRTIYGFIGPRVILQCGQSLEANHQFLKALVRIFVVTLAALVILAVVFGWLLSKRALAGVAAVTLTASRITSDSLQERVVLSRRYGDEIDRLAAAFNTMLDRIESLVSGIREMSANMAHDLRSPITRIRGLAEVTLTTAATRGDYENMTGNTIEECDRLLDMINTLLMISKAEAGVENLQRENLDISSLVDEACELFVPLAEDQKVKFIRNIHGPLTVRGDMKMIQRMIANLLDNAIKYTPANGEVKVSVTMASHDAFVVVTIVDTGSGIDVQDLPLVFKRFFRCDESRSLPGTGLGLSLARAVACVHGGDIVVASRKGKGSTFTITLPVQSALQTNLAIKSKSKPVLVS